MTDFSDELAKVAKHIAKKAIDKDTSFGDSVDAFKHLTLYYALLLKNKGIPEDDEDASNFVNFGKRFDKQESENGGQGLSNRRRITRTDPVS